MEYCSPRLLTLLPKSMIIFLLHFLSPQIITTTQASPVIKMFASPLMMWQHYCINASGTYNESSMYEQDLNVIVSWFTSSPQTIHGFYNASIGEGEDQVNAIGLCRGDSTNSTCLSCLNDAANKLPQRCPNQKDGIAFYEGCMFRYSNRPILHKMDISPTLCLVTDENTTDADLLNRTRAGLLQRLKKQALGYKGSSSSVPYFAMGEVNGTGGNLTLYAMIQCTPDLTVSACSDCIDVAVRQLVRLSYARQGGRVYMPSCSIRYEPVSFFYSSQPPDPPVPATSPPFHPQVPSTPRTESKSKTFKYVIAAVLPAVTFLALFAFVCYFVRRTKSRMPTQQPQMVEANGDMSTVDSLQFDFDTIKDATNNFSLDNKLGQGGFGAVYKGKLRDGQEIAVKRLASNNSEQGEAQFKNEIALLAKLQHRNLVRLLGFCLAKEERLLVYEFVPNASLDHFLFDPKKHEYLDWEKRTNIIGGTVRGLLYLHEDSRLRIIHRDLKASNILLDAEMDPKIADFGLAKLFSADQTHADTSVIAGTYGYMAPEYVSQGLVSVKADVYSFGILLLEIICGRRNRPVGENAMSLINLVWRSWREGTILSITDPTLLVVDSIGSEVTRYIHIGLLCVQHNENQRPAMSSVLLMLSSNSTSLPLPSTPGFMSSTPPPQEYDVCDRSYSRSTRSSTNNEDSVH